VVPESAKILQIFDWLLFLERSRGYHIEIFQKYFEVMLRSTQAKTVVFQWLASKELKLK
jgi:hypothetical protein